MGLYTRGYLTKDSAEYIQQALNLRSQFTFYCGSLSEPLIPELFSLRPPGYGLFLTVLCIGKQEVILPLLVQVILSVFTLYIAWKSITIITGKSLNAVWFLIPVSAFLVQCIYAGTVMS